MLFFLLQSVFLVIRIRYSHDLADLFNEHQSGERFDQDVFNACTHYVC
jgi:hypothetical protein